MPSLNQILSRRPPTVSRIIAELNKKRPESEQFLTTNELAERLGVHQVCIRSNAGHKDLAGYFYTISRVHYWGSPKDIKALREKMNG